MSLYFHHVGIAGSQRDFPKTVWGEVAIDTIKDHVAEGDPYRATLLQDLARKHPSGVFNCWGVPAGAHTVIKHLSPGDVVLLVETTHLGGSVPAICSVDVFCRGELRELSRALWGEDHFPYIFFFKTFRLRYSWDEMREHMQYAPGFDPRGNFYKVHHSRPTSFPSQSAYVEWLRQERAAG